MPSPEQCFTSTTETTLETLPSTPFIAGTADLSVGKSVASIASTQ
jgi:hypothetical protein